jgi:hypothetical protein
VRHERPAAWRLAHSLGFEEVHHYAGGKMDWLGRGEPYEGDADLIARHLDAAVTCRPEDPVSAVRQRARDEATQPGGYR